MKFCPSCGIDLSRYYEIESTWADPPAGAYDQTSTWKKLMERAEKIRHSPPQAMALVTAALRPLERVKNYPLKTIVHIVLDRPVVPAGGVLYMATMLDGRTPMDQERLEALGYAMDGGKVVVVDEVPVGPAYSAIQYWGGEKQHKRWHLAEPVTLEPSRNGNPYFMDDGMIAFGATWADNTRMEESLLELLTLFELGVKHAKTIAQPLALEIANH